MEYFGRSKSLHSRFMMSSAIYWTKHSQDPFYNFSPKGLIVFLIPVPNARRSMDKRRGLRPVTSLLFAGSLENDSDLCPYEHRVAATLSNELMFLERNRGKVPFSRAAYC